MKKKTLIILAIIIVAIVPLSYTITAVVAFLCGVWVSYLINSQFTIHNENC